MHTSGECPYLWIWSLIVFLRILTDLVVLYLFGKHETSPPPAVKTLPLHERLLRSQAHRMRAANFLQLFCRLALVRHARIQWRSFCVVGLETDP